MRDRGEYARISNVAARAGTFPPSIHCGVEYFSCCDAAFRFGQESGRIKGFWIRERNGIPQDRPCVSKHCRSFGDMEAKIFIILGDHVGNALCLCERHSI